MVELITGGLLASGAADLLKSIRMQDLIYTGLAVFLALTIYQYYLTPNDGIITILVERVIGWPKCTSFLCLAPSETSLKTVMATVGGSYSPNSTEAWFGILFSSIDLFKGIFGIMIVLLAMYSIIKAIYEWYNYWGVFEEL